MISKVITQIQEDFEIGDIESIEQLLSFVPVKNLENYLPEEVIDVDFSEIAKKDIEEWTDEELDVVINEMNKDGLESEMGETSKESDFWD